MNLIKLDTSLKVLILIATFAGGFFMLDIYSAIDLDTLANAAEQYNQIPPTEDTSGIPSTETVANNPWNIDIVNITIYGLGVLTFVTLIVLGVTYIK